MKKIELGQVATDKLTGFTGTVIAKIEYVTGCIQYQLKPHGLRDGKTIPAEWFDEWCLGVADANSGGPVGEMPKPQYPES